LGFNVLLKVGAPVTVNALVPVVTTTVVGLLIFTSIPALPGRVPDPITTIMNVLDATVQDAHATPEKGGEPTLAVQV